MFDGELVVLDDQGASLFYPMMFNKAAPIFAVFDVLMIEGEDIRHLPLWQRKSILEGCTVRGVSSDVLYVDHVEGKGKKLYEQICALDMEGIVAKPVESPYGRAKGRNPWWKIKNPDYSQVEGRGELFHGPRKAYSAPSDRGLEHD